jgi:hypothetical protein
MQMHTFVTEVAGASFHQNPGVLIQGEDVILERVPTNKVHSNAIAVLDKNGVRAGWIPRKLADILALEMHSADFCWISAVAEGKNFIRVHYKK